MKRSTCAVAGTARFRDHAGTVPAVPAQCLRRVARDGPGVRSLRSDETLDDLRQRLLNARFTTRSGAAPWKGGTDPEYLRELVGYWADGFDWRELEAAS